MSGSPSAAWARAAQSDTRAARFVRCALQVNPFAYLERHGKKTTFAGQDAYDQSIVAACQANDIGVIAVTDHYEVSSSQSLIRTATDAGIIVFPGFEAVSSDGVHLLILFEVGTDIREVDRCIGDCGVTRRDTPSPLSDKYDAVALMARARQWGAACIAAHVAGDGGLLKLTGQARMRAWKSDDLQAVALPGPVGDAPQNLRPILLNKNPQYERERLPAVLNAKDVSDPAHLGSVSHSCWIKMSEPSLLALRMAFLDHDSRIRLASDPQPVEHSRIAAIRWEGGFLDGISISFSEDLSVLIGGPGAGKSTVIESLRFALELAPEVEDAKADHEGIIRYVVGAGTTISVLVHQAHPSHAEYVVERTVSRPAVVRSAESGDLLELRPSDLLPRPEIFGQHEISEMARDPQRRTSLLERFRAVDARRQRRLEKLSQDLEETRTKINDIDAQLGRVDDRLAELPRIEETLERYRKAGVEDRLKEQSRLVTERQVFVAAREEIASIGDIADELEEALPPGPLPALSSKTDGHAAVKLNRDVSAALATLGTSAEKAAETLRTAVENASGAVDALESDWRSREREVERKLKAALRSLERDRLDGQEFIDLRAELEELKPLQQERDRLAKAREKHVAGRRRLLVDREGQLAADLRDLRRAAADATRRLGGRVRIEVEGDSDSEPVVGLLGDVVSGRMKETLETLRADAQLSVRELAECVRGGADEIRSRWEVPEAQAAKLAALDEPTLMEIEELVFPTETTIELNLARSGESARWEPLEHLSKGQKATAILLLLLLESAGPLVVDQPEDDLDNAFIYEDVVPSVRREKRGRQFVFATHNANIPVLGDAGLIVGLSATGEAGAGRAELLPEHLGSIDVETVRTLVEERLEGGHAAFELRRRKYGI